MHNISPEIEDETPVRRPAFSSGIPWWLPESGLPQYYLQGTGALICHTPCEVITVLGPCVAVTFFSARFHIASICHCMLPAPAKGETPTAQGAARWKYVSEAVPALSRHARKLSSRPASVEVSLFGGSNLFHKDSSDDVGMANVTLARELLARDGFKINKFDVGGDTGRKIVFDMQTGVVRVQHFILSANKTSSKQAHGKSNA